MDRLKFFIKDNIRLLLGLTVVIFFTILIISILFTKNKKTEVTINNETFKVEIADTDSEKQIGLSKKNKLGENDGMLFIFPKPDYYSFWMRDMKFPIDIIYIKGNRVTYVVPNAPAPSETNGNLRIYQPKIESDKVLEINAGLAEKYDIKEGTEVNINNL